MSHPPVNATRTPHEDGSTSLSLLERLGADEQEAWSELVHLYSPLIVYWCRKLGAHDKDCEDLLQEVFRSAVTNLKQFTKDRRSSTFRGWLRTITHSRVADHYRRHNKQPSAPGGTEAQIRIGNLPDLTDAVDEDDNGVGERSAEQALYLRAIELIRGEFKEQTWNAFWRTAVDGCPATDVAAELGMRAGTVRVAKSRVLQKLRERLGDLVD